MSRMTLMFHQKAQIHAKHADLERAELLILKALKSYSMSLGPIQEDATEGTIAVVSFYNEQCESHGIDMDMVVEDLHQHHIQKCGIQTPP